MDTSTPQPEDKKGPQNNWAAPVSRLSVANLPAKAINLNVQGRQLSSPLRGFGQLWQKTYRIRLSGAEVTPQEVIRVWKSNFQKFWPKDNYFYGSGIDGIAPGDVAVLNLAGPGGVTAPGHTPVISTGIMVIYADDVSFSFMTPEGHMFAGMNTFSAYEEDNDTFVQIQALVRANDPIYELSFRLGFGHKTEDDFWLKTAENLAAHFGVKTKASLTKDLIDPRVQWKEAKNIWHNAAVRTGIYLMLAPFRWIGKKIKGQ